MCVNRHWYDTLPKETQENTKTIDFLIRLNANTHISHEREATAKRMVEKNG